MRKFKEKLEIDLLKAMTYTEINNLLNKLNRQIETLQKKVNKGQSLPIDSVIVPKGTFYCDCVQPSMQKPISETEYECFDCGKEIKNIETEQCTIPSVSTEHKKYMVWDDLFGILAWKFKQTKSGDMYLDGEKVYNELKEKFELKRK